MPPFVRTMSLTRRPRLTLGDVPPAQPVIANPRQEGIRLGNLAAQLRQGWDLPPPNHTEINCGSLLPLPVGSVRTLIVDFQVPAGYVAVVSLIANGLSNLGDSPFVLWSFAVDGGDVPGYSQFVGLIAPSITYPRGVRLGYGPGQVIQWYATNTGAALVAGAAASFAGWMWSTALGGGG
jgi:hypothetical protein